MTLEDIRMSERKVEMKVFLHFYFYSPLPSFFLFDQNFIFTLTLLNHTSPFKTLSLKQSYLIKLWLFENVNQMFPAGKERK